MTANLFDLNYYRQANQDLAAVGLTTDEQLTNHFFTYGVFEGGRPFSRFANLSFYRASNPDLAVLNNNLSLYNHLAENGVREGRRFSPFYDTQFYKSAYPDLMNAGLDNEGLYNHVQNSGLNEGRRFSPFFDIQYYRQNYNDLANLDNAGLLEHFKVSGLAEGREASRFVDIDFYINYISSYQDLAATRATVNNNRALAFQELQSSGLRQGQRFSPIVDLDFYRDYNPDLAFLDNGTLFNQLVLEGSQQGRRLSASYDPVFYLNANPDLALAGINSSQQLLEHFTSSGLNENRQASDSYNPSFYLNNHADLGANGLTTPQQALFHYEARGLREGRQANNLAISAATAGTFLGNATNLGVFSTGRSGLIQERIDNNNSSDVYRFTVAAPSNVSLQLADINAQVNYTLAYDRNANGQVEADEVISNAQTSSNSNIGGALAAGTYYLIVQQLSANQETNYSLNLSSNGIGGINTSRDPGETAATALDLGVLSITPTTIEFNEFIGTSDTEDIYRFTTTELGSFSAQVFNISSPLTADIIIDGNNNGIFEDGETLLSSSGDVNNNIFLNNLFDEPALTFYIRIKPNPSTTKGTYSLGYIF
jgi:hypothetical protein